MLNKILHRISGMHKLTEMIISVGLKLSCLLLFGAAVILCCIGEFSVNTYELHYCADEMVRSASAVLLMTVVGSACVEDILAN